VDIAPIIKVSVYSEADYVESSRLSQLRRHPD
jgi:hypothetical protein